MIDGEQREHLLKIGKNCGLTDIASLRQLIDDVGLLRQLLIALDNAPDIAYRPDYEVAPWATIFIHEFEARIRARNTTDVVDGLDEFGCPVVSPGVTPLPPGPEHLVRRGW